MKIPPCFRHQILANLKVNSYLIPLIFENSMGAFFEGSEEANTALSF